MRYLVLGIIDGLITAGTLSASLMFSGGVIDIEFALALSVVVASINALIALVAEFSHQMREVREAIYRVSLREERGKWTLVHSRALYDTLKSALSSFVSSLVGALAVLIPASYMPQAALLAVAASIVVISLLLAGGSWVEFIQFAALLSLAVAFGLLVGLAFPVIK
ncbi:MAG: VIT1/CCC1 transporter family protein [Pyrobaculum sp.]|nr:VIT1/CCC1 transporter family protein [Pyrobaculum sp.]